MDFIQKKLNSTVIHYREEQNILFGFTETDSEIEDVWKFSGAENILQLEQVHGNKIYFSDEVKGSPDGDGIILNEKNVMAVIRTADCTPLFFRNSTENTAGVIHVGWRGLYSKIGENLLTLLGQKGTDTKDLFFFSGPAIEGKCYTVQQDVVDKFKGFSFSDQIFTKIPEGYSMDVTKGIELCLIENGVPNTNISHSGICTYCDPRFPSYRQGDREKRIFNFVMMK